MWLQGLNPVYAEVLSACSLHWAPLQHSKQPITGPPWFHGGIAASAALVTAGPAVSAAALCAASRGQQGSSLLRFVVVMMTAAAAAALIHEAVAASMSLIGCRVRRSGCGGNKGSSSCTSSAIMYSLNGCPSGCGGVTVGLLLTCGFIIASVWPPGRERHHRRCDASLQRHCRQHARGWGCHQRRDGWAGHKGSIFRAGCTRSGAQCASSAVLPTAVASERHQQEP